MFRIVNEHLFSSNVTCATNDHGSYYKIDLNTSPKIVKLGENDEYIPSIRTVLKITSPDKEYSSHRMVISSRKTERGLTNILLRAMSDTAKCDDAMVYAIAVPFNGVVMPIPECEQYRIRKGFVSISDRKDLMMNNRKYRKIFYMIVEVDKSLFENGVEEIPMTIQSCNIYKDFKNPDAPERSTLETYTIKFKPDGYDTSTNYKIVDKIDTEEFRGKPFFTIYDDPDAAPAPVRKDPPSAE